MDRRSIEREPGFRPRLAATQKTPLTSTFSDVLSPSRQKHLLGLALAHSVSYAHFLVKLAFNFVFCIRAKLARMGFEPDIFRPVGSSRPLWEKVIKLIGGLVRVGRQSVRHEDRVFRGITDGAKVATVRARQ